MVANRILSKRGQERGAVGQRRIVSNNKETPVRSRNRSSRTTRPAELQLDLVPGVRDRMQARLTAMGVPPDRAVSHVAGITQRSVQSVRRWFDPLHPGLPDLESFARLCAGLGSSADSMIGRACDAAHEAAHGASMIQVANCIHSFTDSLTRRGCLGVPMRVPGDEMAPRLNAGDVVFVDTTVTRLAGNGIYALTCDDNILIRRVEQRTDKGIVLKCDNKAYRDHEWMGVASVARRRVKILGKVHGAISVHVF